MSDRPDQYFIPASEEHMARERNKARELRRSQWWKNRTGQGKCHYCERRFHPRELTMDHVVPLVRGGFTARSNVVPCCGECNTNKKDLIPFEWEAYLAGLQRSGE
jgi:5-methylcytosine-specific restriction endonuclease McrA|tara:strand:- start:117 stop:431 length:315 start_codon:yes stop_codon:yes gene_type:complete